ncbi:50S ribosomal protein L21 [Frondihabitans cladoniiphilus]|uniref:Large ribosomal subunit protein bL21 n=1 Tax=Frondihabitans cladoniiphilus TaxID=715785 RepID=A0ABP8VME5_9MICO
MVFAVVRAGGRQEKVEVGTILTVDRLKANESDTVTFVPVLHVDGDTILAGSDLANVTVTGEVLNDLRGPKIVIQNYKNKTGYKRRMGFRADLTRVRITDITTK